jgi:nicotinamide-nucleotide amidase
MTAALLLRALGQKRWKVATAESCTGGLVAGAITEIAGSSEIFDRGFVTYSNTAKTELLGVPVALIEKHGAVSEQVARAMAEGALRNAHADVAVAVTGIAGPGGGSVEKPVGLVHFACATKSETQHIEKRFGALSRTDIRAAAVAVALQLVLDAV